jgi:hypothetical protein
MIFKRAVMDERNKGNETEEDFNLSFSSDLNETIVRQPSEYDSQFGILVKAIRQSKPRGANSRGRSDYPYMSQIELAINLREVWNETTDQKRNFDSSFISDLESGKVRISRLLAECVIKALGANDIEGAILLEAGGFNGLASLLFTIFNGTNEQVSLDYIVRDISSANISLSQGIEILSMRVKRTLAEMIKMIEDTKLRYRELELDDIPSIENEIIEIAKISPSAALVQLCSFVEKTIRNAIPIATKSNILISSRTTRVILKDLLDNSIIDAEDYDSLTTLFRLRNIAVHSVGETEKPIALEDVIHYLTAALHVKTRLKGLVLKC